MEMFYLWLGLGSGVLIPQPYPSLEACKAAGDQVQQIYYHNSICIPAPVSKYLNSAPIDDCTPTPQGNLLICKGGSIQLPYINNGAK